MTGQMCWLSALPNSEKVLHLREDESKPWRPHKTFSFAVPDYLVPGGSKGYATMQVLMKRGWKLVGTKAAEEAIAQQVSRI